MLRYLLLLLLPSLCFGQSPNFEVLDRNIVQVRAHRDHPTEQQDPDETGTGFVVSLGGGVLRILTASHVVRDATKVDVTFSSDKVTSVPVRVLPQMSDALDVAVLELRLAPGIRIPPQLMILPWVPKDGMHVSEHLWTVNGSWEPVPNTIIRLDHEGNPQLFEYTEVSVGEGYSGAPVFNDKGLLMGIHVKKAARGGYKLSVAVKIDAALETLEALGYSRSSFVGLTEAVRRPNPNPTTNPNQATNPKPAAPAPQNTAPPKPVLWRNLTNNQLYQIRVNAGHLYISQQDGKVVADLGFGKNKNGVELYSGNSSLSDCPGSGYMEITQVTASRIEGRIERKPTASNGVSTTQCGGFFGKLRQLVHVAFIREQ